MKSLTLKWINVAGIVLLVTALVILFLAMTWSVNHLIASVGWNELVSVGWWVTVPM
jgi:hypothetical protein